MSISKKTVNYVLDSAFSGGIGYWVLDSEVIDKPAKAKYWSDIITMGGSISFTPDNLDDTPIAYILNYDKVLKGLELMADKYPKHYALIKTDNFDASTGDILVQLALFNDLIYG